MPARPRRSTLLPWLFPALKDPLVRMIVVHWGLGMALGAVTAGMVLALDIAHLWTLLQHSDIEWAGALLLFLGFGVTFGGVVSATAVMFGTQRDQD